MKTSAGYSIHDVSERARIEEEKTADIIADNIDLEIQNRNLSEEIATLKANQGRTCPHCRRYTPAGCSELHEATCDTYL